MTARQVTFYDGAGRQSEAYLRCGALNLTRRQNMAAKKAAKKSTKKAAKKTAKKAKKK
jgi:hypothetical protein